MHFTITSNCRKNVHVYRQTSLMGSEKASQRFISRIEIPILPKLLSAIFTNIEILRVFVGEMFIYNEVGVFEPFQYVVFVA